MDKENLTEEEIKKRYNTTCVNIKSFWGSTKYLQVQHYQTKEYHYFVWGTAFWKKLDITSLNPQFFHNWIGE